MNKPIAKVNIDQMIDAKTLSPLSVTLTHLRPLVKKTHHVNSINARTQGKLAATKNSSEIFCIIILGYMDMQRLLYHDHAIIERLRCFDILHSKQVA